MASMTYRYVLTLIESIPELFSENFHTLCCPPPRYFSYRSHFSCGFYVVVVKSLQFVFLDLFWNFSSVSVSIKIFQNSLQFSRAGEKGRAAGKGKVRGARGGCDTPALPISRTLQCYETINNFLSE